MLIEQKLRELTNAPSVSELSKEIGISKATLYKAIENPNTCNTKTLVKICNFLKLDIGEVMKEKQARKK